MRLRSKEQELPYEEAGEQAKKGGGEPNHQMDYCDNIRLSTVILNIQMLKGGSHQWLVKKAP